MKKRPGEHKFTLVDLVITILVVGFLAIIIFFVLQPSKRFGESRDGMRWTEVNALLSAIIKYQIAHDGELPVGLDDLPQTIQVIGTNSSGCDKGCGEIATESACLDLSGLVGDYIVAIPQDPKTGTPGFTGYYINKDAQGKITVGACNPEQNNIITVTK